MTYLGPFIISTMFTSSKTRSAETRPILIDSMLAATTGIRVLAGHLASHDDSGEHAVVPTCREPACIL